MVSSQASDWDAKWYRIGRRLSCVAMSVQMTEKEWTEKHESGEIVSVLIFAGKYLDNEHGSARFLTLRRVESELGEDWHAHPNNSFPGQLLKQSSNVHENTSEKPGSEYSDSIRDIFFYYMFKELLKGQRSKQWH
jgi:hypothetical protein